MKILAIRGRNIASLTEFDIDFRAEPLRSAGIFAITGPTGAGKSSILDAMCLALFQKAPRLDGFTGKERIESRFGAILQNDIRNILRRGCDTGFAECEFVGQDGSAYRARWGYRAPQKSNAAVQEEMSLVRLDDGRVLEGGAKSKGEFQSRILSLVGLSYGQFMRTVLLAQGRFAEFLRSDVDERADLLEKLTGTEVFTRISKKIFERTKAVREEVEEIERQIGSLSLLTEEEREAREIELSGLKEAGERAERRRQDLRRFLDGNVRLVVLEGDRTGLAKDRELVGIRLREAESGVESAKRDLESAQARQKTLAPEMESARGLDAEQATCQALLLEKQGALENRRREWERAAVQRDEAAAMREELANRVESDRAWIEAKRAKLEQLASDWARWEERLGQCGKIRLEMAGLRRGLVDRKDEIGKAESTLASRQREAAALEIREEMDSASVGIELERIAKRKLACTGARSWFELVRDISDLTNSVESFRRQLELGEASLPALEAAWNLARRLHEETRSALSKDVEHLRAGLRSGVPCPVCGSEDHPWAVELPKFDALLARHEEEEAAAGNALQERRAELERSRVRFEAESAKLADAGNRLERLSPDPVIQREAQGKTDPIGWIDAESARLEVEENRGIEMLGRISKRDALRKEIVELRAKAESATESVQRDEARLVELEAEFEALMASLDAPFGGSGWREKWSSNPGFAAQVAGWVREFSQRRDSLAKTESELGAAESGLQARESALVEKNLQVADSEAEREKAVEACEGVQGRRAVLLGGRPVRQVETEIQEEQDRARKHLEKAEGSRRKEAEQLSGLDGRLTEIVKQIDLESEETGRIGAAVLGRSDAKLESGDSGLAEALLVAVERELSEGSGRAAEITLAIRNDSANRGRSEAFAKELVGKRANLEAWTLLNQQIGSADGKAFKKIAQEFTLEILLEEANAQLRAIAPRYSLRMLGRSMHFGVLDHESYDEMRPVHTLSGGESFLVSLGLALGLSRMAGGDLAVESLFIDEGFGTLDSDTLRCVMAALSSLHSQGRKVGLITHVEEMKEQIPVRIEVVKLGQGASRVEVRG